jgi:hypothetical protein
MEPYVPGEDTAMRVLTISRGYTKVCAAAPAKPPAANLSATVALPGSCARRRFRMSKATNLVAVSGMTLTTLAPLPRKNARGPPSRYTALAASDRVRRPAPPPGPRPDDAPAPAPEAAVAAAADDDIRDPAVANNPPPPPRLQPAALAAALAVNVLVEELAAEVEAAAELAPEDEEAAAAEVEEAPEAAAEVEAEVEAVPVGVGTLPICRIVLTRSMGAVAVRDTAPATPPLMSFAATPAASPRSKSFGTVV